jgi:threonine dehydrogenase-like Zn-dependent dehydrogenase
LGQVVTFEGPREVGIREYEERPLQPNEVRLRTLYSGISAGTELTAYRGSNPYLSKRWDEDRRLFLEGGVSLQHPIEGWGYEEVGEVAEVGPEVTEVRLGEVVWGTWATKAPRWCRKTGRRNGGCRLAWTRCSGSSRGSGL